MPTPSEIQTCINNLTTISQPIDFTLLAAETSNANVGISFSVATIDDLPDLTVTNIGSGQIVFVESISVPVISTCNEWKGLDGRLLRRDYDIRSLFSWGSNTSGRLGIGSTNPADTCSPVREFCSATDWCRVSAGCTFTVAVKTSGQIWAWGDNTCGRLGDGTAIDRWSPVREFCSATDWCQVSAIGDRGALAIKTSGQLWAWGSNYAGVIGDGTATTRLSPVRERCSATDWCHVSGGIQHSIAIKTTGQLWVWGRNHCGNLGDGTVTNRCSPVREFCSATDWCQASGGFIRSAAIKTTGELWAWGLNSYGVLGDGTYATRCSPVREFCSATDWCQMSGKSFSHNAAIKTSGQLWSWGCGGGGLLGTGAAGTGSSSASPVREFCSATDWCMAGAGGATVAIKTSGQLWGWGGGGLTGDGTATSRCSPVREFYKATDWIAVDIGPLHVVGLRIS